MRQEWKCLQYIKILVLFILCSLQKILWKCVFTKFVCLFGFYSISTFVRYLMPIPFLYKSFYFKQFSLELIYSSNLKTVLFQAIQFNMNTLFRFIWIGPYQVLPLWARVDLGAMTMKGYSTFPEPYHQIV